jgi:hypothetical protein
MLSIQFKRKSLPGMMSRSRAGEFGRKEEFPGHDSNVQNIESMDSIDLDIFSERRSDQPKTRQTSNLWSLPGKASRTDIRLHSYSERVVENWNA